MKRSFLILAAMGLGLTAIAQPILVGHRGSGYGVESTEEAFRNGASLGYQYVESDVKVTGDGRFILSHDDDLTRLGGTLTIATSTLEALQAETLTQTRSGVTYTGHAASLDDMLDLCTELNMKPLIELKWATGINNNDCSKIPDLIALIEEKGFRSSCIILTSMKPCLEYIRTNYPDITLQFLTGQYWSNHFEWCVQWRIDVDIQAGYFDKSTVKKYHNEGLLVNMWTTNDEAGYRSYGNMGCDFITTDRLDGHNLPELDHDVVFPPNTVDYPENEGEPHGRYTAEVVKNVTDFSVAEGYSVRRAVSDGTNWYVLAHSSAKEPVLFSVDPAGATKNLSLEGVEGGSVALNDIALTADGYLVGCNEATVPFAGGGEAWRVYIWRTMEGNPEVLYEVAESPNVGNWNNALTGNSLAVSGRLNDLKVYTTSRSNVGTTYRVCGLQLNNGEFVAGSYALDGSYTVDNFGDFTMTVSPLSRDNLLISSPTFAPVEYHFIWEGTRLPMDYIDEASAVLASKPAYVRIGEKPYMVVAEVVDGSVVPVMYDYSNGIGGVQVVSDAQSANLNVSGFNAVSAKTNADGVTEIGIIGNGALAQWAVNKPKEVIPVADYNFKLEPKWVNSNTTGNAPQHIDGTNAQQGTAVNGIFYVNDCVDQLLYIFDETGCIGSIPGGKGWGCARDDAGNIIVRNDKNTGAEHSFLIYAAGAMPDNYQEAVALDVTINLEGQTNFISASGNVLSSRGGHIYMFPNKQNAADVIALAEGEVTSVTTHKDLALTGTTAAYVIPFEDDSENWLYHVRSSGIYFYHSGTNADVMTSRPSTSAPARNSTCGFGYMVCGSNQILVHNSGANYKGGFTVRDLSTDKVYATVDPIGTLGYETGGNYSVSNWITVECNGFADYTIYQYCPSNGMAVYHFYDTTTTGVNAAVAPKANIEVAGGVVKSSERGIRVYDLAGRQIRSTSGSTLSVEDLGTGIYVITAGSTAVKVRL